MQTGRRYFQIEIVAQPFLELFDKEYASPRIEFAHPFHMAEEKSFGDETRQGSLINRWGVLVHDSAHLDEGVDKLWRGGPKNQAQRLGKELSHRARVKHPAGTVPNLNTWQGGPH